VTRENGQRNLTIRIDNRDRDLTSYLEEAQKKIDARVRLDRNKIRLEWGGQFENQRRAEARLLVILGLVMGMMLIFLTVGLKSFRQALLILGWCRSPPWAASSRCTSPARTSTWRAAWDSSPCSRCGSERHHHGVEPEPHAQVRPRSARGHHAGRDRKAAPRTDDGHGRDPGMLPAAIHTGVGSDVQRGIATVVVGGLAISTILTLFVLPSMYHVIEHWAERRHGQARWGQ